MLRGILIGSAAALAVGGGLVAAAVVNRHAAPRPAAPAPAATDARLRITLTNPKEPVRPLGPKLETLPPGTETTPFTTVIAPPAPVPQAPPAPVRPPPRDPQAREFARTERYRLEPEPELRDFAEDDEPAYLERGPDDGYADPRRPWRERRNERRRVERYPEPEPYYPEPFPPPWERR